ncbi:DNA (cytosine-5-)-methyltransferase [Erwinia sp. OLTSP20]|uniref:DNA cytosine methyltransferase n=1 Tax=unclassified Erwinia TaxID=2622719 RepID=UPI000C18027F|nr:MULTISPECIES: DNA cytosine methyltransferase [unclassified Erwinia]PIJ48528.1 DNA (cytosine-5-)-methyltransferase [Erwinia sp. OAMSP11]PIJ69152.1 DNA (cytosine-5-)-methyltransferase [Erwinia sp. OLSSP12]PIJ78793.1 DNA (cytosine-5-)-methyltransferase [Erwinia sp. OLCASP19]PIJ81831.1 DNA (cytosine-5-)-methyltransferase [Erwinia sp. OLMTSP26]PIJ82109.1 DNA (cytosine-5-)-methyltransferase [Erwinia sp. OLMDSP33]
MNQLDPLSQADSQPVSEDIRHKQAEDYALLKQVVEIYDQKTVIAQLGQLAQPAWSREALNRWLKGKPGRVFSEAEVAVLRGMLPAPPACHPHYRFRFIDLFAGIGGIRSGFESIGGQCVFTSEWNKFAQRTYKANWYCDAQQHRFNHDIRDITLSANPAIDEQQAYQHIDRQIADHDVLLAGFPCQPFSLAGVSKKNALGRAHGFECEAQGTLFFDVARIIAAKKPAIFVLENVKNLKSHDQGRTFRIIMSTLDELGYDVADAAEYGSSDPKIIDGKHFLPQHRERIVLVGLRRDLALPPFSLKNISRYYPKRRPLLRELLESAPDEKYILTPALWKYLYNYARKHQAKGNGFGYGLVDPQLETGVVRTLSARYYKDGSEILLDRGWDKQLAEQDFYHADNLQRRPRRLTPRECARLMGFEQPGATDFRIPVSDTQAYRQFGNSVVVPVFTAVAQLLQPWIELAVSNGDAERT